MITTIQYTSPISNRCRLTIVILSSLSFALFFFKSPIFFHAIFDDFIHSQFCPRYSIFKNRCASVDIDKLEFLFSLKNYRSLPNYTIESMTSLYVPRLLFTDILRHNRERFERLEKKRKMWLGYHIFVERALTAVHSSSINLLCHVFKQKWWIVFGNLIRFFCSTRNPPSSPLLSLSHFDIFYLSRFVKVLECLLVVVIVVVVVCWYFGLKDRGLFLFVGAEVICIVWAFICIFGYYGIHTCSYRFLAHMRFKRIWIWFCVILIVVLKIKCNVWLGEKCGQQQTNERQQQL